MKDIIIIDGNSLLYRAYFATAAMGNLMTNQDGIPTNAVFGFANMLINILQRKPSNIMVAFDYGKKTFRNDMFEVYKGTRKETPSELVMQFSMIREFLDAHNIKYQEIEGYEGDDIIGTVAKKFASNDYKVSIFTSDKDMLQLVDDKISVLLTKKGVGDLQEVTPESFYETYGLVPDQMRDLKGLMGDKADNIPGIPGIGEKTAIKLLLEYNSVENLSNHLDELKGKMGERIRDNIDQGILSKKIATIITDVPMDIELTEYEYLGYDYDTLANFYRKYGMNSLLKKMALSQDDSQNVKEIKYQVVSDIPVINEPSSFIVGVYDKNYHKSPIVGFAISTKENNYFITLDNAYNAPNFKNYLINDSYDKYTYDLKKASVALYWHQLKAGGFTFDLQLASYILNPALKDEIKNVCEYYQYYDVLYDEEVFGKGAKKTIPSVEVVANHLCKQSRAIYELKDIVIARLEDEKQYDLYSQVELPVAKILSKMEISGAKVDRTVLKALHLQFDQRIKKLEKDIYLKSGCEFNISSPKQLGEVLFEELKLPFGKKTKTGYSTAADVLEQLAPDYPIVKDILDYRMLTKLESTYVSGLQDQIYVDGKVHTMYNQALTQTGRLSSTDPNLQNIPVRTEEGKMIRKAFIPSFDYLVSFDYSQIELRVLAHLANVPSLIKAFNDGKDIHSHTASEVFNVLEDKVDSDLRRKAKAVNFGIIYGMSSHGLAQQIGVDYKEADNFINSYFARYPEIKTYMDSNISFCEQHGYVATILNRKRYISEINEKNFIRKNLGKRLAMNSPIQGSAADILKLAMIKVDNLLSEANLESKMILQVHDELILDVKKSELDQVMKIVKEGMENAYKMLVDLKAEGNYATNWYELK